MKMYTTLMSAYGASCGIDFKFGGTVTNTIDAMGGAMGAGDQSGRGRDEGC